ncbi:NADH dehydrogenase [ubiquinone] 1 beta subcomplex subunit 8, mitochondrial-like [Sycon ciliatum]|uniref:NADH dehydrogenase [ubiquinone] 1 beta subcomplex subunit 8, mitochondrial-like n=1 Tax=Sycon ciliatum TaxID=27933 RepID=UPI0031F68420
MAMLRCSKLALSCGARTPVQPAAGAMSHLSPITTVQRRCEGTSVTERNPLLKRFYTWFGSYEPTTDLGNYPRLPRVHMNELPTYGWQDNYDRRNLNTIIHDDFDTLTDWSFDVYAPDRITHLERWYYPLMYCGSIIAFWIAVYLGMKYYMDTCPESAYIRRSMVAKEYPYGNLYIERGGDMRYEDGYFPSGPHMRTSVIYLY